MSIVSGNGLVSSGNKPLPEPKLVIIHDDIWHHWVSKCWYPFCLFLWTNFQIRIIFNIYYQWKFQKWYPQISVPSDYDILQWAAMHGSIEHLFPSTTPVNTWLLGQKQYTHHIIKYLAANQKNLSEYHSKYCGFIVDKCKLHVFAHICKKNQ